MTEIQWIPGPRTFAGYVNRIRGYLLVVATLWALSIFMGAVFAIVMPEEMEKIVGLIAGQFSGMKDMSQPELMLGIFFQNTKSCLIQIVLGIAFGLVPLLVIFVNGIVIGLVIAFTASTKGLLYIIVGLAPHGIVELPMVALSAAIGLRFGHCALKAIIKQPVNIFKELYEGVSIFVVWIIPLLFVAAFLETYVTVALLYYFG